MKRDAKAEMALEIESVSHSFGSRQALNSISLTVSKGNVCGLIGLNGAGKTTLFSLITRLYDNTTGSIQVCGFDVRRTPTLALQRLGVVFQNRSLDPALSVMQNLVYNGALHGLPPRLARQRAHRALDRVSMAARTDEKVAKLSGGQTRRVEIARALLHEPELLLLDEPTVGLDVGARRDIVEHIRKLVSQDNLGVLWATHLINEIGAGDDVVVLHEGNVLASGSVERIVKAAKVRNLADAFDKLIRSAPDKEPKQAA
jgi:ABC-2 type transport system ATP-binding protein